ncbi:unnamed protein product [Prunus armeniaca]
MKNSPESIPQLPDLVPGGERTTAAEIRPKRSNSQRQDGLPRRRSSWVRRWRRQGLIWGGLGAEVTAERFGRF